MIIVGKFICMIKIKPQFQPFLGKASPPTPLPKEREVVGWANSSSFLVGLPLGSQIYITYYIKATSLL